MSAEYLVHNHSNSYSEHWSERGGLLMYVDDKFQYRARVFVVSLLNTVLESHMRRVNNESRETWSLCHASVMTRLRARHDEGWSVVFAENLDNANALRVDVIKSVVQLLLQTLDIPAIALFATRHNCFRKPHTKMIGVLHQLYKKHGDVCERVLVCGSDTERFLAFNARAAFLSAQQFYEGRAVTCEHEQELADVDARLRAGAIGPANGSDASTPAIAQSAHTLTSAGSDASAIGSALVSTGNARALTAGGLDSCTLFQIRKNEARVSAYDRERKRVPFASLFEIVSGSGCMDPVHTTHMLRDLAQRRTRNPFRFFETPLQHELYMFIVMGPPRSGKSTFVRKFMQIWDKKYHNMAVFAVTPPHAENACERYLSDRISVIVDGTNELEHVRAAYAKIARAHAAHVIVVEMDISLNFARVMNHVGVERAADPAVTLVPEVKYREYRARYRANRAHEHILYTPKIDVTREFYMMF